eukprot:COSAG01_NODE_27884_length_674_cov_1.318261_1_plen_103_part_00
MHRADGAGARTAAARVRVYLLGATGYYQMCEVSGGLVRRQLAHCCQLCGLRWRGAVPCRGRLLLLAAAAGYLPTADRSGECGGRSIEPRVALIPRQPRSFAW